MVILCVPLSMFLKGQHLPLKVDQSSGQGREPNVNCVVITDSDSWSLSLSSQCPRAVIFRGTSWSFSRGCLYYHVQQDPQPESESENPSFVFLKPDLSQRFKLIITWNHTNHGKFLSTDTNKSAILQLSKHL